MIPHQIPGHRSLLLRGDPRPDAFAEHVHRKGAGAEDLVVELADVEPLAELLPGLLAQLGDLELADLVAEGLAGPDDVAIRLALHVDLIDGAMVVTELHC